MCEQTMRSLGYKVFILSRQNNQLAGDLIKVSKQRDGLIDTARISARNIDLQRDNEHLRAKNRKLIDVNHKLKIGKEHE